MKRARPLPDPWDARSRSSDLPGSRLVEHPDRAFHQRPPPVDRGAVPVVCYKARLCLNYERGRCVHGDQCSYAHGMHELVQSPLYNTTL